MWVVGDDVGKGREVRMIGGESSDVGIGDRVETEDGVWNGDGKRFVTRHGEPRMGKLT